MSKNDEIILQNKYNRMEARCKDLEEQLRDKEKQWKITETTYREAEFHCRKLCEEILVKDSSEIVLGKQYTWDGISMLDMAVKALFSLRKYNTERTDMQRRLLDISEDRRLKIESLLEQIEVMQVYKKTSSVPAEKKEEKVEPVIVEESQKVEQNPVAAPNISSIEVIIEEDQDIVEADIRDIREMENLAQELRPVARDIPVHPAKRKVREQQNGKARKIMSHMIDISEYKDKITDLMWQMMELIGKEGLSAYTDIENRMNEINNNLITKATIRMSIRSMYSMGILVQEQISDPLRSKFMAYRFSEIGQRLYKEHFGENPVLSELDMIISQHDNPNHGYGILALAKVLQESQAFESVSTDRKANTFPIRRGGIYIPDIVAVHNSKYLYIEYECGTHVQADFAAKCNKVLQLTNDIYIVTPNREVLQKRIMNQVAVWIKEKGGYRALKGKKVYLTTVKALHHENPMDPQCWQVIYDMSSDNPVMQF